MTLTDTAAKLGISKQAIYRALKLNGLTANDIRNSDGDVTQYGEKWIKAHVKRVKVNQTTRNTLEEYAEVQDVKQSESANARLEREIYEKTKKAMRDQLAKVQTELLAQRQANEIMSVQLSYAREQIAILQRTIDTLETIAKAQTAARLPGPRKGVVQALREWWKGTEPQNAEGRQNAK